PAACLAFLTLRYCAALPVRCLPTGGVHCEAVLCAGALMTGFSLVGPLSGLLFSFLGTGLPLGIPPEKEDAIMSHVAPEECILYASWTASAKPSASSANQTEQLLAEPEIQAFVAAVQRNVLSAGIAAAKKNG